MSYHGIRANRAGVGNVYFVCVTGSTTPYAHLIDYQQTTYLDGSTAVQPTITTALAATVSERNDYVIVMPDATDYNQAATSTMAAMSSHLICPAGIGPDVGCLRAATLYSGAAAHGITISGKACEVAGFWIRHYADKYGIYVGTAMANGPWIHHNDFAMEGSGTLGCGVKLIGNVAGSNIEKNFFFDNVSDGTLIGAISCDNGASRTFIKDNVIMISGGSTTVTKAIEIKTNEAWCWIDGNVICEAPSSTVSIGIQSSVNTVVSRNMIAITSSGNAVNGGTSAESYIRNWCGISDNGSGDGVVD